MMKLNLEHFLDEMKDNLQKHDIFNKLLILCAIRSDITILHSAFKKGMIKKPKLFQRNIIELYSKDFESLKSEEFNQAIEIFVLQYLLDESVIKAKINILQYI